MSSMRPSAFSMTASSASCSNRRSVTVCSERNALRVIVSSPEGSAARSASMRTRESELRAREQ
jgi:hypothetical protein